CVSLAMASMERGSGTHASGERMKSTESLLITPSRSSTTSLQASTIMARSRGSGDVEAGEIRHVEEQLAQVLQQRQAVPAQCRVVAHHHDRGKKSVHRIA